MKLGKSSKEEFLLLAANEVHSLDGFGGVSRSLLDGNSGVSEASLSGFIAENLGFLGVMVVLVSDRKGNAVSLSLL